MVAQAAPYRYNVTMSIEGGGEGSENKTDRIPLEKINLGEHARDRWSEFRTHYFSGLSESERENAMSSVTEWAEMQFDKSLLLRLQFENAVVGITVEAGDWSWKDSGRN